MNLEQERTESAIRPPAAAGRFYPGTPDTLRRQVASFLTNGAPSGKEVRAVLAPHAGYRCSGAVAGQAFSALGTAEEAHLVILLGPAHYRPVHGAGLPAARAFATPLGDVPVAVDIVDALAARGAPYARTPNAHRPEHCLEVMLPFLQLTRPRARIVPLLLDDWARPEELADDLAALLDEHPDARIVVSSDLSHFHPYAEAQAMDEAFLTAVVAGEIDQVRRGEACGRQGILTLLHLARRKEWRAERLAYCNSGDTCGSRQEVVGYGAVTYIA